MSSDIFDELRDEIAAATAERDAAVARAEAAEAERDRYAKGCAVTLMRAEAAEARAESAEEADCNAELTTPAGYVVAVCTRLADHEGPHRDGPREWLVTRSPLESLTESHACASIPDDVRHGGPTAPTDEPPDALKVLADAIDRWLEAEAAAEPGSYSSPPAPHLSDISALVRRTLAAEAAIDDLCACVQHLLDRIGSVEDHLALTATDVLQRMQAAHAQETTG